MGLIKLALVGGAGYAIARKVAAKHNSTSTNNGNNTPHAAPRDMDPEPHHRPSYRDTKSGYMHQGYCNGDCGRACNGQQTHGLHDWSCNGQCAGQCATQRQAAGAAAQQGGYHYAAGGLPGYESSGGAGMARAGDVKA